MNYKKYDYEIHKSLTGNELVQNLSECFPIGIKVKYNRNLSEDSYYFHGSIEVLGISEKYGGTVLIQDQEGRSSHIHPSNIHIDLQTIRSNKLKQLGI